MMYLSSSRSRCSAAMAMFSCGAAFLFLLLATSVRGHALPASMMGSGGALTLVEPPQQQQQQPSDSASELYHQPGPQQRWQASARQLSLDRMDSFPAEPSVSEIIRSKRWKLQQIVPPTRSRINNRSMTSAMESGISGEEQLREEELEVNRQLEQQDPDQYDRYDVVGEDEYQEDQSQRALQVRPADDRDDDDSISGALARAARATDIEEYFWKYVVDSDISASLEDDDNDDDDNPEARFKKKKKFHLKHKYKKFLLPLLLAYKLKFMMMFPALVGGLALLVKAAGLAGFFFALFASVVSLQKSH